MLLSGAGAIVFLGLVSVPATAETYVQAVIDQGGQLRIVTKDRREIVPQKEPNQVAFEKPAISPDGRAVGWLALYPNCCTSYPIPLKLMIYAGGKLRTFTGRNYRSGGGAFEAEANRWHSNRKRWMEV